MVVPPTYAPSSILTTGLTGFSGGVNSVRVPTIRSAKNPEGLPPNMLPWLINSAVRDGGISQRKAWQFRCTIADQTNLYQGGYMYEPNFGDPYLMLSLSGRIIKVDVNSNGISDVTGAFAGNSPQFNPISTPQAFFAQAEEFLIIQAGDFGDKSVGPDAAGNYGTKPFFWDGTILRRSKGITSTSATPGQSGVNEIPAATCMVDYMERLWYAQGRTYSAGDIVGGTSGTLAYKFRDAVLNVTENPLVVGGDGFTVPASAGNIRFLGFNAVMDATNGQGRLIVSTRKRVFSLQVPVTRDDWINASSNNKPLQTVMQDHNGWVNDRSVVAVNGDLYGQSLEPSIRSLLTATRLFNQPGNISISKNEQRVWAVEDRSLQKFASGIFFDNRLLQTVLPKQVAQGVIHQAIIPLDFVPISGFNEQVPPAWEGIYEGLNFLQLFTGDFGGRERAFAIVVSQLDSSIQLWELTDSGLFDTNESGESRIVSVIEFPALTWHEYGAEDKLKELIAGELWIDQLFGNIYVKVEFRPDGESCWQLWHEFIQCSARDSGEDAINPKTYPRAQYYSGYRETITIPKPPTLCTQQRSRGVNIAYQFQPRLTIKGSCRVRGFWMHALPIERELYANLVCQ